MKALRPLILGCLLLVAPSCGGRTDTDPGGAAGAGGSSGTQTATCASTCAITERTCSQSVADCTHDCETVRATYARCPSEFDALLACLGSHPVLCGSDGTAVVPQSCQAQQQTLVDCLSGITPSP